jgi:hypothetical protein
MPHRRNHHTEKKRDTGSGAMIAIALVLAIILFFLLRNIVSKKTEDVVVCRKTPDGNL